MTNINATVEQISEAIDWTSDCLGYSGDRRCSAAQGVRYVERNYPGGWDAFVNECAV